jgi:uncharacterized BrkB/YihY/UPF0761 family membrane protein
MSPADARTSDAAASEVRLPRRMLDGAIELYWGSGLCDDVPALSWFFISALVPLALGMTALASLALGDYAQAQAVAERAARVLPADVGDQVVQLILRTRRDSPLLVAGSVGLMVWTSAGAVGVLERSMSRLLRRRRFGPVLAKVRHLLLAAGVVVVVVLMVLAASKATNLQRRLGVGDAGVQWLLSLGAVAATGVVCAALYRFCPREGIPWRAAAAGAAPAALALQIVPTLAAYYLGWVAGTTPVRVFLVLAGVLFTSYLAALGLLLGAAVAVRRVGRSEGGEAT